MPALKLNNEFKVVFQPRDPEQYGKRRFGIGACSLEKYIGENNANTAIEKALNLRMYKLRLRYRKHGIIDIYLK